MNTYPIQKLSDAMGGELILGEGNGLVESGVSTDTRSLVPGALFFALSGENFDAHDFLDQAVPDWTEGGLPKCTQVDLDDFIDSEERGPLFGNAKFVKVAIKSTCGSYLHDLGVGGIQLQESDEVRPHLGRLTM